MKAYIFAAKYFCHPDCCIFLALGTNSVHLCGVIKRRPLRSAPLYHPFFPPYLSGCWFCSHSSLLIPAAGDDTVHFALQEHTQWRLHQSAQVLSWLTPELRHHRERSKQNIPASYPDCPTIWPLLLWHPISDTTLLRTVRAAIQPDLLAIGPLGHLHPASGLFLLQEAELNCLVSVETPINLRGQCFCCLIHAKQYYSYLHSTTHWA